MNDQDIERLLQQTAPVEAPFGPRTPRHEPARRFPIIPIAAAAILAAFFGWIASHAGRFTPRRANETEDMVRRLPDPQAEKELWYQPDAAREVARAAREGSAHALKLEPWLHPTVPISVSSVFVVRFDVFDPAAAAENLPEWLMVADRPFMVLVRGAETAPVRLHLHETRPEMLPEINVIWMRGAQVGQFLREGPVALPKRDLREVFAAWPRLRDASFAFMAADALSLFLGLEAAASGGPSRVRSAAVHALRHYFTARSVAAAIAALDDGDEAVRAVAQDTLRVLIAPPAGNVAEWWKSAERQPILERQFERRREELRKP